MGKAPSLEDIVSSIYLAYGRTMAKQIIVADASDIIAAGMGPFRWIPKVR